MKCSVKGCKHKAICWKNLKGFCDEHSSFSKKKLKDHNRTLMKEQTKTSMLNILMSKLFQK
jgi:hypothetical protein